MTGKIVLLACVVALMAAPAMSREPAPGIPKLSAERVCGDISVGANPANAEPFGICVEREQFAYDWSKFMAPRIAPDDMRWCVATAVQVRRAYEVLYECLLGRYHRELPNQIR